MGRRSIVCGALPPVRAAALRPILQPAQDHDLRRLHRNPEKHHFAAHPGSLTSSAMDVTTSTEQLILQQTLQRFIGRDYGFERRRELTRSALGFSAEAWARYAELGLLSLPFPA